MMYVENEVLATAVADKDLEKIKELHTNGEDLNQRCIPVLRGLTPIMWFAMNNDAEMIKFFVSLDPNIDLDEHEFFHGNSALLFAVGSGAYEACEALIEAGADKEYCNRYSMGALDLIDDILDYEETDEIRELIEWHKNHGHVELAESMQRPPLTAEQKEVFERIKSLFE